jgi:hypothetical protein
MLHQWQGIETGMSDITPTPAGDFDLTQGIFSGFEESNAGIGMSFGTGDCGEETSRTAADDDNLRWSIVHNSVGRRIGGEVRKKSSRGNSKMIEHLWC